MKLTIIIIIGLLVMVPVLIIIYGTNAANKKPANDPAWFLANKQLFHKKKVVVCAGNSITHGRVSANYVDLLGERLGTEFQTVNAGVNGDLAWNVLQRLDEIVACQPDYITLLIGSNDCKGVLVEEDGNISMKKKCLPQMPTDDWYLKNLDSICQQLRSETDARIALLSLPPLGEDLSHPAYQISVRYNKMIEETAERHGIDYLPLGEEMATYLEEQDQVPGLSYDDGFRAPMYKAIFAHFILGRSFDEIAAANGLLLMTDLLHLNETAAGMAADLIRDFVNSN